MNETETIKLPSGRVLTISPAPFRTAEALNDAIMEECAELQKDTPTELDVRAVLGRVILKGFSSKKIKAAIWACMPRVLIDKAKVTEETFEDVSMRSDYYIVCYHVAEVNVRPFMKDLSSQFEGIIVKLAGSVPA